jgi:5-methylcytosine-specific restriction endonuclease McrA
MRSATPLDRDAADDYRIVLASARSDEEAASLTRREQDVSDLYTLYAEGNRRPHQIASSRAWGQDAEWQREAWRLASQTGPLAELYGQVLKAAGHFCLLCNASRPGEVDHFLPRDEHPALSVLHLNLIGVCDKCNKHKASSCRLLPTEQFVHPYFDQIPMDAFLHCSPLEDAVLKPLFHVAPKNDWPDDLGSRLTWQFHRLRLDKYYGDAAIAFFKGQSFGWLGTARGGWEPLEESLTGALDSEVFAFGSNTWKAAMLRGLLADPDLRADPVTTIGRNGAVGLDKFI